MNMNPASYFADIPNLHTWDNGETWNTGGFNGNQLSSIYNLIIGELSPKPSIVETGAGNSTITFLLTNPEWVLSIAPDLELFDRIKNFCQLHQIDTSKLDAIIEFFQWELPKVCSEFQSKQGVFDFGLIDGCHGMTTCFLDLEYMHRLIKAEGMLMIDDIHLHSCREMAKLLLEQPEYSLVMDLDKALIFKKIEYRRKWFGGWVDQPYVVRKSAENQNKSIFCE